MSGVWIWTPQQALSMDMRFAAEGAKFTTAFTRRGLIAEGGMSSLTSSSQPPLSVPKSTLKEPPLHPRIWAAPPFVLLTSEPKPSIGALPGSSSTCRLVTKYSARPRSTLWAGQVRLTRGSVECRAPGSESARSCPPIQGYGCENP